SFSQSIEFWHEHTEINPLYWAKPQTHIESAAPDTAGSVPKRQQAHFRINEKVLESSYKQVEELLGDYNEDSKKLTKHVVWRFLRTGKPCPVAWELIWREARNAETTRLRESGLLIASRYSKEEHLSREWTPGQSLLEAALGPQIIEASE